MDNIIKYLKAMKDSVIMIILFVALVFSASGLIYAVECQEDPLGWSMCLQMPEGLATRKAYQSSDSLAKTYKSQGWTLVHYESPQEVNDDQNYRHPRPEGFDCYAGYYFERPNAGRCETISFHVDCRCFGYGNETCPSFEKSLVTAPTGERNGGKCPQMWPERQVPTGKLSTTNSSNIPVPQNSCSFSDSDEQKRQEIFKELADKYKFKIEDTNLCGKPSCKEQLPWSFEEISIIKDTLNDLPACFINKLSLNSMRNVIEDSQTGIYEHDYCCCSGKEGWCGNSAYYEPGTQSIIFCVANRRPGFIADKTTLKRSVVHEMTHALQYYPVDNESNFYNNPLVVDWNNTFGWSCYSTTGCVWHGQEKSPSDYGTINPLEDMAESVKFYYNKPEGMEDLKTLSPGRYEFIKNNIMCGKEFR